MTELRDLAPGQRFAFFAFPEQTATLIAKGQGRATIRYDKTQDAERTFEAEQIIDGEKVRKTVTIRTPVMAERPCSLGAQVVKL